MRYILAFSCFFIALLFTQPACSQTVVPDQVPYFALTDFKSYIESRTTYPESAMQAGITGKVFIEFVVTDNGEITDAKVLKGIGYGCDEEALKTVKATSGNWNPARLKGVPISFKQTVFVRFQPRLDIPAVSAKSKMILREKEAEEEFTFVEDEPQPPGGDLQAYFAQNIKYPQKALSTEHQGKVFVTFVITSRGEVSDVKVLKGIGYGCDEEAIRVVKAMPLWTPGKNGGRAVKVRMNIPIVFRLDTWKKDSKQNTDVLLVFKPGSFPEYVRDSLKVMPDTVGEIWLSFLVDAEGMVQHPVIEHSLSKVLDDEVLRILNTTNGKWTPAMSGRKKITAETRYSLSIGEEIKAIPPEGDLVAFINHNLFVPKEAKEKEVNGEFGLKFRVGYDGRISQIEFTKSSCCGWNEEATRLLNLSSGLWTPKKRNGVAVNSELSLNFQFPY